MNEFAKYIEQFRIDPGLTSAELAEIMGVSDAGLENFLDDYVPPSQRALERLIAALALREERDLILPPERLPFGPIDPESLISNAGGTYAVKDGGLADRGIASGDRAFIKPCGQPKDGDILLVSVRGADPELMAYSESGALLSNAGAELTLPRDGSEIKILGRLARLERRYE